MVTGAVGLAFGLVKKTLLRKKEDPGLVAWASPPASARRVPPLAGEVVDQSLCSRGPADGSFWLFEAGDTVAVERSDGTLRVGRFMGKLRRTDATGKLKVHFSLTRFLSRLILLALAPPPSPHPRMWDKLVLAIVWHLAICPRQPPWGSRFLFRCRTGADWGQPLRE